MNFTRWDGTWWDEQRNASGRIERMEWKELRRKDWMELNIWEERRTAKLHFKRIRRISCTLRGKLERYLNSSNKNLDEHLKNELNHEEPPWRTPVTKRWWDRMKAERIRWALRWFRWRFWRNGRVILNSGKEKVKTLGTRIYSSRTKSEGRDYLTTMK